MTELTNKELVKSIESRIGFLVNTSIPKLYPELKKDADTGGDDSIRHYRVKHFQAIDRINMYLAYFIAKTSFYDFNLLDLLKKKDRKTLKAINNLIQETEYDYIRKVWHEELKSIFYAQKEMKAESEKLQNVCVLLRMEIGEERGFVSIINDEIKLVKSPIDATEFTAVTSDDTALKLVEKHIFDKYIWECRAFFNKKVLGRNIYQW